MKTFRVTLALLSLGLSLSAQEAPPPNLLPPSSATVAQPRSPQELDQLLAPIALYPDALIALILPATTVPTDIVLAARHLRENPGDRSQIEHRAWDESVKSLTNYPEVIQWMDENLHWTQQVGEAFATQSADVMQAVQRLRAKARAAGTLVDTPQQQVIAEPQVIRIVPAQPDIIYVPHYEPEIVFVDRPIYYGRPFLTFGVGVPVGSWLAFDCDWRRHSIWVGNRHRRWTGHDWHRPVVSFAPSHNYTRSPDVRQWRPPSSTVRTSVTVTQRFRPEVVRPSPFGLATSRINSAYRDAGAASRRGGYSAPPVAPPLARNFTPDSRANFNGPRSAPRPVAPATVPLPATVPNRFTPAQPIAPAPTVSPSISERRGREWSRNSNPSSRPDANNNNNDRSRGDDNRGHSFRSSPVATAPAAVPPAPVIAPPIQMHSSRSNPVPRSNPVMGSTPQRSFSRSTPTSDSAPSLRMHGRSAPPPAIQPIAPRAAPSPPVIAAPQAAPQQAAPARQNGGESRGHRGTYRRDN
jgi:hypothetical protein